MTQTELEAQELSHREVCGNGQSESIYNQPALSHNGEICWNVAVTQLQYSCVSDWPHYAIGRLLSCRVFKKDLGKKNISLFLVVRRGKPRCVCVCLEIHFQGQEDKVRKKGRKERTK